MKSTYHRLIKILSCSLAIAAVLLCSVCMPALAASWTTLIPADHISNVRYEGNIRVVSYDFGIAPVVYYSATGQSGNFYTSTDFQIDSQLDFPFNFGIYPLGKYSEANYPLSHRTSGGIAIDASDFKSEAVLALTSNFRVELDIGYYSEPLAAIESYGLGVSWSFLQYSDTGEYLGFLDGGSLSFNPRLQAMDQYYVFEYNVDHSCSIKLPSSDVGYLVPWASLTLSCIDDISGIHVNSLRFVFDDFTISTRTDMLLKDSLTMEAIEGELGELNDKADTIINGSDEMQDTADDLMNGQQDLDEQLANAMAELDDLSDISDQLAADQYTDFFGSVDKISGFLVKAPWLDMTNLIQPIMDFAPMVTILTMLVAFINISILFFGR